MKKILLPVLALAIVSCRPPYDGDLSYTAALAGKMRLEATVGPVKSSYNKSGSPDIAFLPLKTGTGVDAESGFIIFTDSLGSSFWYVEPDAYGGYLVIRGNQASSYNSDPHYPVFDFETIKTGSYISIMVFKTDNPVNNVVTRNHANTGTMSVDNDETVLATNININADPDPRLLAAQIYPSLDLDRDVIHFLVRESLSYREMQGILSNSLGIAVNTSNVNGTAYNLAFLPFGITRCLYYRDPVAAMSYASFYSDGTWQCWRWSDNPLDPANPFQARLAGVAKRIDALLTTGELLSTQDDVGRVYDSEGNLRADFHLGGLKFAFEAYIAGVAHVFFSQMYVIEEQMYFNVYSIRTAKLRDF